MNKKNNSDQQKSSIKQEIRNNNTSSFSAKQEKIYKLSLKDLKINTKIELVSKSMIRYCGTLNKNGEDIILTHVSAFGTEDRKCVHPVAATKNIYDKMNLKTSNIHCFKYNNEWIYLEEFKDSLSLDESDIFTARHVIEKDKFLVSKESSLNLNNLNNLENTIDNIKDKCDSNAKMKNVYDIRPYSENMCNKLDDKSKDRKSALNDSFHETNISQENNIYKSDSISLNNSNHNNNFYENDLSSVNDNQNESYANTKNKYKNKKQKVKNTFGYYGSSYNNNQNKSFGYDNKEFIDKVKNNANKRFNSYKNTLENAEILNKENNVRCEIENKGKKPIYKKNEHLNVMIPENDFDLGKSDEKVKKNKEELQEESKLFYDPDKGFFDNLKRDL